MLQDREYVTTIKTLLDDAALRLQNILTPMSVFDGNTEAAAGLVKMLYPYRPELILDLLAERAAQHPVDTEMFALICNLAGDALDATDPLFYSIPYNGTTIEPWAEKLGAHLAPIHNRASHSPIKYGLNVIAQVVYALDPAVRDEQLGDLVGGYLSSDREVKTLATTLQAFTNAYHDYVNQTMIHSNHG